MSVIAAAVEAMLAAGVPAEVVVAAVAKMEAVQAPVRTARQERNARYYQKRQEVAEAKGVPVREVKTVKTVQDDAKTHPDDIKTLQPAVGLQENEGPQTPKKTQPLPLTPSSQGARAAKPAKRQTGSLCPENFQPTQAHIDRVKAAGLDEAFLIRCRDDMVDWSRANGNRAVARKLDWDRTFHGWLQREISKLQPARPGANGFQRGDGAAVLLRRELEREREQHAQQDHYATDVRPFAVTATRSTAAPGRYDF